MLLDHNESIPEAVGPAANNRTPETLKSSPSQAFYKLSELIHHCAPDKQGSHLVRPLV
jgi:hypothetical protein